MKNDGKSKLILARAIGIRLAMVVYDVLAVNFAYYFALIIRYYINHELLEKANVYLDAMWQFAPYYTICCLVVFFCFRLYSGMWKYAGLNDMNRILLANVLTAVIQVAGTLIFIRRMTITYYVLGAFIQFVLIAASRFSYRLITAEVTKIARGKNRTAINVMIVGTGETGLIVRKRIENDQNNAAHPVCIFTQRKNENSGMMDGIPVISGMDNLTNALKKYGVDCVILADGVLPSETRKQIRTICQEANVGVQDFSGGFLNDNGHLSFRTLMEYTSGAVLVVVDGKSQKFSNGEQAILTLTDKYDVKSVSAQADIVVVELTKHMVTLNNVDEEWAHEFEKETGEQISFF